MKMKSLIKSIVALTPYRVLRGAANRFQAFDACFDLLKRLGYEPRFVIDGGAHLGDFALTAQAVFPRAHIHMVEPQPACRAALENLAAARGFSFHPYALASPEEAAGGTLHLAVSEGPSTGAHIVSTGAKSQTEAIAAATLDRLFADKIRPEDRALLKLDLQGYELAALRGAEEALRKVEVILVEVSFFAQAYEPPIAALVHHLDEKGFVLFDIASLAGRTRDGRLRQGDFIFVKRGSALVADGRWE
jgi:FkbM family methyltransferase